MSTRGSSSILSANTTSGVPRGGVEGVRFDPSTNQVIFTRDVLIQDDLAVAGKILDPDVLPLYGDVSIGSNGNPHTLDVWGVTTLHAALNADTISAPQVDVLEDKTQNITTATTAGTTVIEGDWQVRDSENATGVRINANGMGTGAENVVLVTRQGGQITTSQLNTVHVGSTSIELKDSGGNTRASFNAETDTNDIYGELTVHDDLTVQGHTSLNTITILSGVNPFSLAGDIDAESLYTVKNLAAGVNAGDAATKGQLDGKQDASANLSAVASAAATAGNYLRGDGTTFASSAIQAADLPSAIDATKIGSGAVSSTEFGYLDGVTSGIQTQLDARVTATAATGAAVLPAGTTAERPTAAGGLLRYNTESHTFEGASGSSPAWGPIGGGGGGGPAWSGETESYTSYGLIQAPPQQISAASITGTPTRLYCQCLTNSYAIFTDAGASAFVWVCNKDISTGTWTFGARVAVDFINNVVRAAGNKVVVLSNNGAGSGSVKEYTYAAGTISFTRTLASGNFLLMDLSPDGLYVLAVFWNGSNASQPSLYYWNGASWVTATNSAFTAETWNFSQGSSLCLMLDGVVNRFGICDQSSGSGSPLRIKMYDVTLGSTPVINTTASQTISFTNGTPSGWTYTNAQLLYDTTNVAYQYLHLTTGGDGFGRMRSYEWSGGTFTHRLDTTLGLSGSDYMGWNNNTIGNMGNRAAAIWQDKLVVLGYYNPLRQYSLVKTSGSPYLAVTYESEILPAGGTFGVTSSIALSPDGTSLGYYKDNSATPEYLEFFARAPDGSISVSYEETADNLEAAGILRLTGPYLKLPVTPAGTVQSLVPAVDDGLLFLDSVTGTLRYLWQDAWQVLAFGTSTGGTLLSGYVPGSGNLSINGQLLQCTRIYKGLEAGSGVPLVELQAESLCLGVDLTTPASPTIANLSTGRFTATSWAFAISQEGSGSSERYRIVGTPTGNAQSAATAVLTLVNGVQTAAGYAATPRQCVFYANGQASSNPYVEVQVMNGAGSVSSGGTWLLHLAVQWSVNS